MTKRLGDFSVFVPMLKVDEEQRLVYGVMAEEVLDNSGEIFDYATSKPHFEKWSEDTYSTSNGMSKGNVRTMHGSVAAGKLTDIAFDDAARRIECCAKIVDDNEWNKVLEGVYTGFSIGGRYAKRWAEKMDDGGKATRYTAQPVEVSLVDKPCIPTATFQMIKKDGTVETRRLGKAYNEDQERDENGKFGSGGGSGGADSGAQSADDLYDRATEAGISVGDMDEGVAEALDYDLVGAAEQFRDAMPSDTEITIGGSTDSGEAVGLISLIRSQGDDKDFEIQISRSAGGSFNIDYSDGDPSAVDSMISALEGPDNSGNYGKKSGGNIMKPEYVPTNDELLPVARNLAKADGKSEGDWAMFLEAARDQLVKAFDPESLKDEEKEDSKKMKRSDDGEPLDGEEREKALEGEAGADAASADAESNKVKKEDDEDDDEAMKFDVVQVWKTTDGQTFSKKADAVAHERVMSRPREPRLSDLIKTAKAEVEALTKADGEKPEGEYGDVEYADPGYQEDKRPRYPVDTEQHIRAAWNYISREENAAEYSADQVERMKNRIVSAWKEKIDEEGPPSAEKMVAFGDLGKAVAIIQSEEFFAKSLWNVQCLAGILRDVQCLHECVGWEAKNGGDGSDLHAKLKMAAGSLGTILVQMVSEEVGDMVGGSQDSPMLALSAGALGLEKADVLKAVEISKRDMARIQKIHNYTVGMGAMCEKMEASEDDEMTEKMAKFDTAIQENSLLKADLASAKEEISEAKDMLKSLMADIEKIKSMPMPSAPRTHVVDKSGDVAKADTNTPDLSKMTADQLADLAIRMSQAGGKRVI